MNFEDYILDDKLSINHIRESIDFDGIENFTHIKKIEIDGYNFKILNIGQLKYLRDLERLQIIGSDITDISFISGLNKLYSVNLSNNQISDISPLKNLYLTTLWLYNNKITDISCMRKFRNTITSMSLMNNNIRDFSPLSYLQNTTELYIGDNMKSFEENLSSSLIMALGQMKNLCQVNEYGDMKHLRYMYKLEKLLSK